MWNKNEVLETDKIFQGSAKFATLQLVITITTIDI